MQIQSNWERKGMNRRYTILSLLSQKTNKKKPIKKKVELSGKIYIFIEHKQGIVK